MTPDELSSLLRASPTNSPGRGPACPDEHAIAAFVDGTLGTDAREPLETHLADCTHCLALVGLLSRGRAAHATESAPEPAIVRARALAQPRSRHWRPFAPQWAAAAVAVLAMAALVRLSQPSGPTADSGERSDVPTTRTGTATLPGLRLLSPSPGTTVSRKQLIFRWTAVPGTHYYDVRVVTDAGDVVTEEHVTGTEWRLKNPTALRPGLEYFVHVDAYVSDGKAIGSEHVSFHVSE